MKIDKVARVVFISAAGVGASWKQIPVKSKLLFSTVLRIILAQHALEEHIFAKSDLCWTAARAAVLTTKIGDVYG